MLRHVILFKFRASASEQQRQQALNMVKGLGSLPQVREWSVGLQAYHRDKAYDMALVSTFDNVNTLEEFRAHPEHVKVRDYLSRVADWVVVDYELKH